MAVAALVPQRWPGWAIIAGILLPGCVPLSGAAAEPAPAWFDAGLASLVERLWLHNASAVGETHDPIDFGDLWAWTGDNAKTLSAMSEAGAARHDAAKTIADFILRMRHGPILFQRWANMAEPLVVRDAAGTIEVSNHLYTLQADRATGDVRVLLEYHDGRNKRMATFAPAEIQRAGAWERLQHGHAWVEASAGSVTVHFAYEGPAGNTTESFRVDGNPRVERTLKATDADIEAVRMRHRQLAVVIPQENLPPAFYHELVAPGADPRPIGDAARDAALAARAAPWYLLMDRGRTDEFANGLLMRPHADFRGVRVTQTDSADSDSLLGFDAEFGPSPDGRWTQDATILDGVATGSPQVYGEIAANLTDGSLVGRDLSLSYEYCETVLGLIDYAHDTGDAASLTAATEMFRNYLGYYPRGTQTRSLGSAIFVAIKLWRATGEPEWRTQATTLGDVLHQYQVAAPAPDPGAVINQPGGGPFLDSTILAARAWAELANVTRDARYSDWSDAAWGSLQADGDRIFFRDSQADDNHWAFKTGLVLQGAPDVPEPLLWAARNHIWTVVRDLEDFEVRTSRYSSETNSETQAWGLLGLLRDHRTRFGPWIVDADAPLVPLETRANATRVAVPFPGAFVFAERGWLPFEDGVPAPRSPGPLETWKYSGNTELRFVPSRTTHLAAGFHALGFPGVTAAAAPSLLLRELPVDVAWSYDPSNGTWSYWVPDTGGTLARIDPGAAVLVRLNASADYEWAEAPTPTAVPLPGWTLMVPPAASDAWWSRGYRIEAALPGPPTRPEWIATPIDAAFVGTDTATPPPTPPMLILGRIDQPYAYRLQGGHVNAIVNGTVHGDAAIEKDGAFSLVVSATPGTRILALEASDAKGVPVARLSLPFEQGGLARPVLQPPAAPAAPPLAVIGILLLVAAMLAVVGVAIGTRRALR